MTDEPSSNRIERRLTTPFPLTALEDYAEDPGVVERDSKFQIPEMVWALVFGFATGESEHSLRSVALTMLLPTRRSRLVASTSG